MKKLLTANNIEIKRSLMNKPETAELLVSNGILTREDIFNHDDQKPQREIKNKHMQDLPSYPKHVRITDTSTEEIEDYPSVHRAIKETRHTGRTFILHNGKLFKKRYLIEVYNPTEKTERISKLFSK
jgi:hypothetical protein